jgi:endo-1,4-beta-xylanase
MVAIAGLATALPIQLSGARTKEPPPPLKLLAKAKGLLLGAESDVDITRQPKPYQDLYTRHCALLAPNFDWQWVSPKPDVVNDIFNSNLDFAAEHQMRLTGGHIFWRDHLPAWFGDLSRAQALDAMALRARQVVQRCGAFSFSWNVANEQLDRNGEGENGLRPSPVPGLTGAEFLEAAFDAVQAASPSFLLTYNDFGMEIDTPASRKKRAALLRVIEGWKARGRPIAAVGLQSHLSIESANAFREGAFADFLRNLGDLGVRVIISELDVSDRGAEKAVAQRDQQVADLYSRFLGVALDSPAVGALVLWGMSDSASWLNVSKVKQNIRADGLPQRPLTFDTRFRRKSAFDAVLGALQNTPVRPPMDLAAASGAAVPPTTHNLMGLDPIDR